MSRWRVIYLLAFGKVLYNMVTMRHSIVAPYDRWTYLTLPLASSYKISELLASFPPVTTLLVRGSEATSMLDRDMEDVFFRSKLELEECCLSG